MFLKEKRNMIKFYKLLKRLPKGVQLMKKILNIKYGMRP